MKIDNSFLVIGSNDLRRISSYLYYMDDDFLQPFGNLEKIEYSSTSEKYMAETSLMEFDTPNLSKYRFGVLDKTSKDVNSNGAITQFSNGYFLKLYVPIGIQGIAFYDNNNLPSFRLIKQTSVEWNEILSNSFGRVNFNIQEENFDRVLTILDVNEEYNGNYFVQTHIDKKDVHANIFTNYLAEVSDKQFFNKNLLDLLVKTKNSHICRGVLISDSFDKHYIGAVKNTEKMGAI